MISDIEFSAVSLNSEAEWRALTRQYSAPYSHDYGYCRAISHSLRGKSSADIELLVVRNAGTPIGAVPLASRNYTEYVDIYSPFGCHAWIQPSREGDFATAVTAFGQNRGYVAGYIAVAAPNSQHDFPAPFEAGKSSLILSLENSADSQWRRMKSNLRQSVRAVENDTMYEIFRADPPMTAGLRKRFATLYGDFLNRANPASVYWLTPETLDGLCRLDSVFLVGAKRADEIVAASLFASAHNTTVYLFNAAKNDARRTSAALIWQAIQTSIDNGATSFDLGGGVSERDNLWWFKSRFDAVAVPQYSLQQIYRTDIFAKLCSGLDSRSQGYFPPYQFGWEMRRDSDA